MSKFIFGLLAILIYIVVIEGQANSDKCCQAKTVGGKKYVLVDPEGTTPESCKDSCVYAYANAGNGERFCFRPGNLISECHSESNNSNSKEVLIVGGEHGDRFGERLNSVYKFNTETGDYSYVGDQPQVANGGTLCNNLFCGGFPNHRSCVKFNGNGTFTQLPLTLVQLRSFHLCWGLPSGDMLLLGGDSKRTTERVSANGLSSTEDFSLPYDTSMACGIDLGDTFVVTGGNDGSTKQTVAQYTEDGTVTYLTQLQTGRSSHACAKYINEDGETTLLVTGGHDISPMGLSSTEIYLDSAWSSSQSLPTPRVYFSAATVGNLVYIFGGDGQDRTEILRYDPSKTENAWTSVGNMTEPRRYHTVALLADIY